MIWIHKRRSSFNNSNLAAKIYFACSCFLCIAQSTSSVEFVDYYQSDEHEEDEQSNNTSNTLTTDSAEALEQTVIGLDQVYFAPRWEGEGPPNFTDHPNKVYCKQDYWWRYYVDRIDPPPPHIYARYLRWKRSSIDPSNVTTTTNTANVFIGTYEPSNESDDREIPLYERVEKRSVPNDQEPVDNERKNAPKFQKLSRTGIGRRFTSNHLLPEATPFGAVPVIYPPDRVKRMADKKKKKKNFNPTSSKASSKVRAQTTTTTRRIKIVTMNPSRRAKIQKQIRQTAIPKKKFTEDQSSTTGVWDKLTGLPFYSSTAEWATPKSKPKFKLITATDPEYVESTSEGSSESVEAGDESVPSVDDKYETSNEDVGRQAYNTTAPVRTIIEDPPENRQFEQSSTNNPDEMSSPGPDASAGELRRYFWKMRKLEKGAVNFEYRNRKRHFDFSGNDNLFESRTTIWYNREENIATRLLASFWQSYVVGLLFSLVSELQK